MDDYIMISTDQAAVQHFVQRAHTCLKLYSAGGVNLKKTRVNFDCEVEVDGKRLKIAKLTSPVVPFCGFLLNTLDLNFSINFDRIFNRPIRYSLYVERCNNVGAGLRKALKTFVRMKCEPLVLDSNINCPETVFRTVYQIFLVAALRMHSYLRCLKQRGKRASSNGIFLSKCITEAIMFGSRLIHSRTRNKVYKELFVDDAEDSDDDESSYDQENDSHGNGYAMDTGLGYSDSLPTQLDCPYDETTPPPLLILAPFS